MDRILDHGVRCTALVDGLHEAKSSGLPIGLRKATSNLFRSREQAARYKLDVKSFDHVLHVDQDRMIADVEGMTTYEKLVDETLRYGMLPAVVPQLKTITVGGAVSGLGIESSSFKYGLVHETVAEMEILTGARSVVSCSPHNNRDLFFGFPNSYGTFGYALRLTIRLVPAPPYIHLTQVPFSKPAAFFEHLAQLSTQGAIDFLDGTVFAKDELYVTKAAFADHAPHVSDYTYMDIYYRSIQRKRDDWLTSKDYIWRWDTDWFWCSKHFGVQRPAIRFFAKLALNSRTYQRLMRLSQRLLPSSAAMESVIQDVQIPIEHAPAFCDFLLAEIGITPVWVCPFRSSDRIYDLCGFNPNQLYVNFGFWDMVPSTHEYCHYNKMIENKVAEFGGKKGLYSTSYYDEETFWSMYDRPRYDKLKKAYDPDGLFPDLYSKCVEGR